MQAAENIFIQYILVKLIDRGGLSVTCNSFRGEYQNTSHTESDTWTLSNSCYDITECGILIIFFFFLVCLSDVSLVKKKVGLLLPSILQTLFHADLPRDFFQSRHQELMSSSYTNSTIMRINHYPPLPSTPLPQNTLRCGAHTDYGSITLLFQDSAGGLQVTYTFT